METYTYKQTIKAPAKKVWDILWNDDTYRQWTAPFAPGSRLESDWKVDGKSRFLDAEGNGMASTIRVLNPPFELEFEHLGIVKQGTEDVSSDAAKSLAGSMEKYVLKEESGVTFLEVNIDTEASYKEMMDQGFTKGFDIIKQLAEQ